MHICILRRIFKMATKNGEKTSFSYAKYEENLKKMRELVELADSPTLSPLSPEYEQASPK